MKKRTTAGYVVLLLCLFAAFMASCGNKNTGLLCKSWDCVAADNLEEKENHFLSREDSLAAVNIQQSLKALSWTFNKDHTYECRVAGRLAIGGTYQLLDKGQTLVCAPSSKNNINTYRINTLTEYELVLTGNADGRNIVLHFKPH